jgi:putative Holliday junction resolvase
MARIMALDVGEKTIGVAVCDESETFVFPRQTILRHEGYRRDMNALRDLVTGEQIDKVVVGLPIMMDGSHGRQVEKIKEFVSALERYVTVPIETQDERLSTFEADQILAEARRRPRDRKQVIDSVAAGVILESYLAEKKGGSPARG